tara:strand:+ start:25 stop:786 length:762 start_codon:yes stop_codon:yes gene_type:complete
MKLIFILIIVFLLPLNTFARNKGETEITTEDGIEVYQNEKFYLLKKNVKIVSDNFTLNADNVKINFDKSLYDITILDAKGNVKFVSQISNTEGSGATLNFEIKDEKLKVEGENSKLKTNNIEMFSDGFIEVSNITGEFFLKGLNSKLRNENIIIRGFSIDGIFSNNNDIKEIIYLNVSDEKISYIKNNDTEMYAKKINFDSSISRIELFDEVTIIRNDEKITGDYGTLDTKNNSYKIKSKDQSKVKALILSNE